MLILRTIYNTLRGLVLLGILLTVAALLTLLRFSVYILTMGRWRHGVRAPKAVKYAEFTQQFRKNSAKEAEFVEIPYKIDKNS